MAERTFCPWCGSDQRDPRNDRYSRTIGIEVRGVYDGMLFWRCPDCGGSWHRWPEGSPLHAAAKQYVGAPPQTQEADKEIPHA